MIDLSPHLSKFQQSNLGPLYMSDKAAAEMYLILMGHDAGELAHVERFGPIVAETVAKFLTSPYFARSEWFRKQPVHRTPTLKISGPTIVEPVEPIFHLWKNASVGNGYTIVSCDEAPLSEKYYEERVVEETKVEMGTL